MTSEGAFFRQRSGKGYAAQVTIAVDTNVQAQSIEIQCTGTGGHGQGSIEEASAEGYMDWKQGAVVGCHYALRLCGNPSCRIVITHIRGLTTDTNPTVVAVAAMEAVWKLFAFQPPPEVQAVLEQKIVNSSARPSDEIPHFDEAA